MKKHLRFLILLLACLLFLASCHISGIPRATDENSLYEIQKTDGTHYLVIKDSLKNTPVTSKEFSDLKAMKMILLSGGLTAEQLSPLWTPPDETGKTRVKLFDLDNLYEPILPRGINIHSYSFFKDQYWAVLKSEAFDFEYAAVTFYPKDDFEEQLSNNLNNLAPYQTVVENGIEKKISERIQSRNDPYTSLSIPNYKGVYYRLPLIGKELHVFETYVSTTDTFEDPYIMVVVYLDDGSNAVFQFQGPKQPLSLEQLLKLDSKKLR